MMTGEEALAEMKRIRDIEDGEDRHVAADALLIRILREHGYDEAADVWEDMEKWFA